MNSNDWSIADVAKLAGTTSRTLRHYDDVGLVKPSRIGDNGYRYYDAEALVTLQRVLLLRELGLGIPAIGEMLAGQRDDTHALESHLTWLTQEKKRLDRQMASVEHTIAKLKEGEKPMAEKMFDGFDHTEYKDEVEQRWGTDSYTLSDEWYRGKSEDERIEFMLDSAQLAEDWRAAAAADGASPTSDAALALAKRHYDWLEGIPGTPRDPDGGLKKEYVGWMADMYVADPRFAANYGGVAGAEFVRDALTAFVARES